MPHTHYVKGFTRRDEHGREETACGQFVGASEVAPLGYTPTCWGCAAWLQSLEDEEPADSGPTTDRDDNSPRRRLTRYERLEALADSGCDTWAEARGER